MGVARAARAMFGATALWGASGGVVAGLSTAGAVAGAFVELGTGVALTAIAAALGLRPFALLRALGWRLPAIAAIEAVNVTLYYVALQLAPVGPVMALHLTAPVILTVAALFRGQRPVTARSALSLLLICAALVAFAAEPGGSAGYRAPLLGLALSLGSAFCLALLFVVSHRIPAHVPPMSTAGLQMLCSGLLLSPALLWFAPTPAQLSHLTAVTLTMFAPACWLYWRGVRVLPPITSGTILLGEPLWGAVTAYLFYRLRPSVVEAVAVAFVLTATYLDLAGDRASPRAVDAVPPEERTRDAGPSRRPGAPPGQ